MSRAAGLKASAAVGTLPSARAAFTRICIFVRVFGLLGWLGEWLRDHDLKVMRPGAAEDPVLGAALRWLRRRRFMEGSS